jgi:enoyl-CoA hydratase
VADVFSVERQGDVAVVRMDDGKANAFTEPVFEALQAALARVEGTDAGAVLLTGRAGTFSAGLNLKVLPTLSGPQTGALVTRFGEAVLQLLLFPRPVVAAVSGHALGAGAMLALASDMRLFAEGPFRFGLNEVPGGLMVPSFGVEAARTAVPAERLTEAVVHGRVYAPQEALEARIAHAVLAPDALLPVALEHAQALAQLPTAAYAATKRALREPSVAHARAVLTAEVGRIVAALEGRGSL